MAFIHSFADMSLLSGTQTSLLSFGPKSASDFRITSSFDITSDVKAYAMFTGHAIIQPVLPVADPGQTMVNLILKPFFQPGIGFPPIKYVIYRGLRRDKFLTPGDVVLTTGSELIVSLNAAQNERNILAGTTDAIPLTALFGHDLSPSLTTSLDSFFYKNNIISQFTPIKTGQHIGDFHMGETIGIEIILENSNYSPTIEMSRKLENIIDTASGATIDKRSKREQVLNFIDPAALYGMHFEKNVKVGNHSGLGSYNPPTDDIQGLPIFENIIKHFDTRHIVYLDIRDENGNSLNFYQHYQGVPVAAKEIQIGIVSGSLSQQPYYNNFGWPFYHIADSGNTTTSENSNFITLPLNENPNPLLWGEYARISSPTITPHFVGTIDLLGTSSDWTKEIKITTPNAPTASTAAKAITTIVRLHYIRQVSPLLTSSTSVIPTNRHIDNIFGPVGVLIPWDTTNPTEWITTFHRKYIDARHEGEISFVKTASVVSSNAVTQVIVVSGNILDQMFTNKITIPSGIIAGTYTIKSAATVGANTEITVAEPVGVSTGGFSMNYTKRAIVIVDRQNKRIVAPNINLTTDLTTGNSIHLSLILDIGKDYTVASPPTYTGGSSPKTEIIVNEDISNKGIGYVAQTAIGFDSNGAVLYSLPVDYFEAGSNPRSPYLIQFIGGNSVNDGFIEEIKRLAPDINIDKQRLLPPPGTSPVPVLTYSPNSASRENMFFLGLTITEFDNLEIAASTLANYHSKYFVLKPVASTLSSGGLIQRDMAFKFYEKYEVIMVGVNGSGDYLEAHATPNVFAYSLDRLMFTSEDFGDNSLALLPGTFLHETFEELQRLNSVNMALLASDTDMSLLVTDFIAELSTVSEGDETGVFRVIEDYGTQLLQKARININIGPTRNQDGIPYYARLHMRVAIKNHPHLVHKSTTEHKPFIDRLEMFSRGMEGPARVDFSSHIGLIPILISGFDPFDRNGLGTAPGIGISNPSGNIAYALHGETISNGTRTAILQSYVIPNNFAKFNEGLIESSFKKFIDLAGFSSNPQIEPGNPVRMIITFSQGVEGPLNADFEIERWCARLRKIDNTDNEGILGGHNSLLDSAVTYPLNDDYEWIETTLQYPHMMTSSLGVGGLNPESMVLDQKVWYRYVSASENDATGIKLPFQSYVPYSPDGIIIGNLRADSFIDPSNLLPEPKAPLDIVNPLEPTIVGVSDIGPGSMIGKFTYHIRALNGIGETVGTTTTPIITAAAPGRKLKVTWNSVPNAVGYRIYKQIHYTSGVTGFFLRQSIYDPLITELVDNATGMTAIPMLTTPISTLPPSGLFVDAVHAPGGSYLSNEIGWRVSAMRQMYQPGLNSGHIHINFPDPIVTDRDSMLNRIRNAIRMVLPYL